MRHRDHTYAARVVWEGNTGEGTASYSSYGRDYRVQVSGKRDLEGSADPAFRGDAARHNPEDMFLAAVAACHMLFYLALCARSGIRVVAYEDDARATMKLNPDGGGRFEEVTLHPSVVVDADADLALAERLHETAHERCFVANSCLVPIRHHATVTKE